MTSDNVTCIKDTKVKVDYLKELLIDRTLLTNYPNVFLHVGKILEKEILRTRSALLSIYGIYSIQDSDLPEPSGQKVNLQCKVYMPTEANSSFNFVGRILGPDGSTAKCLQQCLGVKIMVRGRGSMRDRKKEEANIGRPNWEHLSDKLHVVLTVDDFESRAKARLAKASDYITLFLKESTKGSDREDKVKQMQLMELSFQRDLRSTWSLDCHNLLDLGKAGSLYPGPANFLNFSYPAAYPTAPIFSTIHEASQPHHSSPPGFHGRHYYSSPGLAQQAGQQAQPTGQHQHHNQQQSHHHQQQQQQHQHPQGHFTSVPASHGNHMSSANGAGGPHNSQQMAAAAAAMSVGGLAFPPSSLSTNLGSATLFLGPAQTQGHHHHPGSYSPPIGGGGQVTGNSAAALPPGTVAVAPMSYWQAGPSAGPHALSQMTGTATLDYRHLQHHPQQQHQHPHHLHPVGHESLGHVQPTAGYSVPTAPYATAAQLHPQGFSSEMVQPTLGQEYSLCSHDGQPIEGTISSPAAAVTVSGMVSSLVENRCGEVTSVSTLSVGSNPGGNVGPGAMPVNLEGTASDATPSVTKDSSPAAEKSGKHAQANAEGGPVSSPVSGNLASSKNSSGGTNQAATKHNVGVTGAGMKQRYSQKHHNQSNMSRSSQQSQQAQVSLYSTQHQHHQQQQHGPRAGRSEIVTVHVGSSEQSSTAKSVHGLPGGEASKRGGFVAATKQKSSPSVNTESAGATTGKEARVGPTPKPLATAAAITTPAGTKSTPTVAVVSTSDADWPKLPESQITPGLMNLSISDTTSKAI